MSSTNGPSLGAFKATEQRARQNGLSYSFSITVLQFEKLSMKVLTDLLSIKIHFLADVSQAP